MNDNDNDNENDNGDINNVINVNNKHEEIIISLLQIIILRSFLLCTFWSPRAYGVYGVF